MELDQRHTYGYSNAAQDILNTRSAKRQAEFFLKHVPPHGIVLDIGCGTGSITTGLYAHTHAKHVIGIDIEPRQIRVARKQAPEILKHAHDVLKSKSDHLTFVVGDVFRLPFRSESFDAVYGHTVMSQIGEPVYVLGEIRRVLKRAGVVGFREPYHAANVFINAPARAAYTALYGAVLEHNRGNADVGWQIPHTLKYHDFRNIQIEAVMSNTSSPEDRRTMAKYYADMTRTAAFMDQAVFLGLITPEKREALATDIVSEAEAPFGCISFCMIQTLAWK